MVVVGASNRISGPPHSASLFSNTRVPWKEGKNPCDVLEVVIFILAL
jgi:hypothetical protein